MTLKEFQELTSLFGIGFERFTEINRIYMQTGDLDKKEFCEEFMRVLFPHFGFTAENVAEKALKSIENAKN